MVRWQRPTDSGAAPEGHGPLALATGLATRTCRYRTEAHRQRFVHEAAALFAGEPYGQAVDLSQVYEAHVLDPMREVRTLIERKLGDAPVPEKLAFKRQISQRREDFPGEGAIITANNLMIALTIPFSDMNY